MTEPARLPAFFDRVGAVNPFLDNRINGPSPADVDAPGVHHAAFARLTELAVEAHAAGRAVGAVLWGEAGIGKSHVLSRLGRWAEPDNACFVYLHNLQAAPQQLPRSLLNAVVSLLTLGRRDRFHAAPLFKLVHAALLEATQRAEGTYAWSEIESAYHALVDRWAQQAGAATLDRTVYDVLFAFYRSAQRSAKGKEDGGAAALAVRGLSGGGLAAEEARLLGLPPARHREDAVALEDAQQIKQVLVALTRLADCQGRPFVLAFDQVDNLDAEQFGALARFLEALLDSAANLLVVTTGIQATLMHWREEGVVQKSAWDRLAQFELLLQRLNSAQAEQLVRGRLDDFLAPFGAVEEVAPLRQADDLFPLGRAWHERFLRDKIDVRSRDVLNWAREGWRQEQLQLREKGGPAWLEGWAERRSRPGTEIGGEEDQVVIDRAVEEALARKRVELEAPGALPVDADRLAGVLYRLLRQCDQAGHLYGVLDVERLSAPDNAPPPPYNLSVTLQVAGEGPGPGVEQHLGALVLTQESRISVTNYLRRACEAAQPPDRFVLVTDERVGLRLGEKGREYLEELRHGKAGRFQRVELKVAEMIELECLQEVGKAGDVFVELPPGQTRALRPGEAIASHHRRGRYLASRALRELLGVGAAQKPVAEPEAVAPGGEV